MQLTNLKVHLATIFLTWHIIGIESCFSVFREILSKPEKPSKTIEIFNSEPLSDKAPLWDTQEHSLKPSDFFDSSFLDHPLPTNAWWESIGMYFFPQKTNKCNYFFKSVLHERLTSLLTFDLYVEIVVFIESTE